MPTATIWTDSYILKKNLLQEFNMNYSSPLCLSTTTAWNNTYNKCSFNWKLAHIEGVTYKDNEDFHLSFEKSEILWFVYFCIAGTSWGKQLN